ncbi:hypothetical protein [Streptomyces sp. Caat 7-52]|uniref:hypothetical protein n=1 Tax=Streptomyces sp. Caat 7-52 TaxID=2949637 RepID=UPI00203636B3|nr:hypothetical protein [Streptomyces sp. Caat 7-52]
MSETEHFAASYSPLPSTAGVAGSADEGKEGVEGGEGEEGVGTDARFLLRVASLAFRLSPDGIELQQVDLAGHRFTFGTPDRPEDRLPFYTVGPVSDDDVTRADCDFLPLAPSPPWTHLVWLVQQLAIQLDFLSDHGVRLAEINAPSRSWADLMVEHGGARWRVRVPLDRRREPIENPGMVLGEMFAEGRHHELAEGHLIPDAL